MPGMLAVQDVLYMINSISCAAGTQAAAVPGALCPQYTYDGWSGVPRLENNEPPLLQLYSNPKKAKLTVEVGSGVYLVFPDLDLWCLDSLTV